MSTSIRICSYLLLPLIYLLVNVKIAQLGESFPITIVTFLPVLLLLFLERISVKKLMIADTNFFSKPTLPFLFIVYSILTFYFLFVTVQP